MEYSKLGSSGLKVSRCCLGTMTWGRQNSEAEGHEQMDYALDQGINFWDTAELYAVPPNADTYGKTEEIIGTWFAKNGRRDEVILATKVAGPSFPYMRGGNKIDRKNIEQALEDSLKRLQTDYVDLYQLHWPNRSTPHFNKHWPGGIDSTLVDVEAEKNTFLEVLQTLDELIKAGKIRHIGLSDDTPWGIMSYLSTAEKHDLPRMVSIQNEYSLLMQKDEPWITEVCVHEDVAYLPWSPLATGMLSGKYVGGARPEGTRWTLSGQSMARDTKPAEDSVKAYMAVAEKHGLDVTQMALKWVDMRPFVTSTIIGATSMEQLKSNIAAFDLKLSDDVLQDIDSVYRQYPLPY